MANDGRIGATEIKLSLALIGILLTVLAVVVAVRMAGSQRSASAPVVEQLPAPDGAVVPADFRSEVPGPTVLKAHAGPHESAGQAGAAPDASPWTLPVSNLPPNTDQVPASDYMPKLPASSLPLGPSEPLAWPPGTRSEDQQEAQGPAADLSAGVLTAPISPIRPVAEAGDATRDPQRPTADSTGRYPVPPGPAPDCTADPSAADGDSAASGGRLYLAEEGDTLPIIARFELGSEARWSEIYALNRAALGDDPNHVRPGTWLVLPPSPSAARVARQPSPPGPRN